MRTHRTLLVVCLLLGGALPLTAQSNPKLILDEFFNSVDFRTIEISPDGNSRRHRHRPRRLGPVKRKSSTEKGGDSDSDTDSQDEPASQIYLAPV